MSELKPVSPEEWAASLISAGLDPGPALGYRLNHGPYEVAVHIATHDDLGADTRAELVDALQQEISAAIHRVLGRLPVATWRRYADGTTETTRFS
ncbi:hypothetical protein ACFWHW_03915 [Streptomyces pharetrae]|uniref:hypothetical protein n=1 Tax=Streptomyces pharetrae TaxID=291370 RepID=UPI00364C529D